MSERVVIQEEAPMERILTRREILLRKAYPLIAIMAGLMLGSFNFLQYYAIKSNTAPGYVSDLRLNYPMSIGYLAYIFLFHISDQI